MEFLDTPITVGGLLMAILINVVLEVCKSAWKRGETPEEE